MEYSTDEEVSETLLDKSILKGDYAGIDTQKIKRVKREVRITLPTYPESFIAWYKDHGMTAGMKAALRGTGWTDRDIASCKMRFIKRYGVTAGYQLKYPDEALSEDDQPGAGGFADLCATSPPPVVQQGTSSQVREADRYECLISTAKAAMAQREAQSKAGKEAKRKGGPTMEPPPKKTRMPTATLSKAPSDSKTGTVPVTQVLTPGETGSVMALGASPLEDYLTGRDTQTPGTTATVGQVPNPSSGTNPAMQSMGGFLGMGMLPKARPKKVPVPTPIPRRSGGKWIPVLGKPAPSVATAASLLVPQKTTGGTSRESAQGTVPTRTDQSA